MRYYIDDKEFGQVILTFRRGMRNITAHWSTDELHLSAPHGTSEGELRRALDEMRESLRRARSACPVVSFAIGQVIDCFRCRVRLIEQSRFSGRFLFGRDGESLTLGIPASLDLKSRHGIDNVTHALQVLLGREAQRILLPYATEVSARIGVSPSHWEVGRGMRKLGHCTRQEPRTIQLSRNLMFLTEELVHYVICHELAHLTHADHSPRFHALVDVYTGGRERELEQALRRFAWPIVR